jgi:hypothetical protein
MILISYATWAFRLLSNQVNNEVQNYGKQYANYEAGHNREEELKVSLLQEYVTRELSQERNPLPEDQ